MSYSALDYFTSSISNIPTTGELPAHGDVYGEWIHFRQIGSMINTYETFFAGQVDDSRRNKLWDMSIPHDGAHFKVFSDLIDTGDITNLGLLYPTYGPQYLDKCHQVLGIGYTYDEDPENCLIHIYDPNYPNKEMVLVINFEYTVWEERELVEVDGKRYISNQIYDWWHCYFLDRDYEFREPPSPTHPSSVSNDLSDHNLSNWIPPQVQWMDSVVLAGNSYFRNQDLRSYKFENTLFIGNQNLWLSDFQQVETNGSNFKNTKLIQSDLREAKLKNTSFRGSDARYCSFKNAVITGATFYGSDLSNSSFVGVQGNQIQDPDQGTLRVNFSESVLNNVSFNDADLNGAIFFHSRLDNSTSSKNFDRANFEHTNFNMVNFKNTSFKETNLQYSNFCNSVLNSVSFKNASLQNANFCNSTLIDVSFEDTDVFNADFSNSVMNSVNFNGINNYNNAIWTGANITNPKGDKEVLDYIRDHT